MESAKNVLQYYDHRHYEFERVAAELDLRGVVFKNEIAISAVFNSNAWLPSVFVHGAALSTHKEDRCCYDEPVEHS